MDSKIAPWPGIVLALVSGMVLALSGASIALALAVVGIWILSLYLAAPAPPARQEAPVESLQITQSGLGDLIEQSGLPLLLLREDRVVLANAKARGALGQHILGQDPRVALRHPAAIALLAAGEAGTVGAQGLTGPRSNWQVRLQPVNDRYTLVELQNRTAEADLSRAHTDFVANASHELRTPLASIIGYMETLTEEDPDIPPAQEMRFKQTVLKEASRLRTLIDDLLSLSRVEAEKHETPRESLSFAPLVRRAASDGASPDCTERLRFSLPERPITVRGDMRQLEQLVRNLVDNACKYGGDGPVDVRLKSTRRGMAKLEVVDRGIGVSVEDLPHLTRRFYRVDAARSRAAGGTGLGLAIVKHIVERHRGRIDFDSVLGQGTSVRVWIPLATDSADS